MPKKDSKNIDISSGFKELEQIADWFEKGEPDIDAGVQKFERAMMIADALKTKLVSAENKIKEIKKKFNVE
ncbi:MAG: exodeoxyribonuclease VII small subunit [Patescibacteria group bacterium]